MLVRNALVAQLDRVSGYEPAGRRFESYQARQMNPYTVMVCKDFSFCLNLMKIPFVPYLPLKDSKTYVKIQK